MKSVGRLSVLIVHPQLSNPGGAELVALRFIERVIKKFQANVTILCSKYFELDDIQKKTEIYFPTDNVNIIVAGQPLWLSRVYPSFHQLRLAFLHRSAKSIAKKFDICIGTYNEIDFGKKGIQYIHHPSFAASSFLDTFEMGGGSKFKKVRMLEKAYQMLVRRISLDTVQGFRNNVTLTNSEFISDKIMQLYGIESSVIYPSVSKENIHEPTIPLKNRRLCFVNIGRIAPDKSITEFIDICRIISTILPQAEYMIIGRVGKTAYYKHIVKYIEKNKVPVQIFTDMEIKNLQRILQESKFFIGTKRYEHYGIATLEAANAGCLTFVHDSGGQTEIITSPFLRYKTTKDLIEKIMHLLDDEESQRHVLADMKAGISKYTLQKFYAGIDEKIENLILSEK